MQSNSLTLKHSLSDKLCLTEFFQPPYSPLKNWYLILSQKTTREIKWKHEWTEKRKS